VTAKLQKNSSNFPQLQQKRKEKKYILESAIALSI